jgi:hypothetical protein
VQKQKLTIAVATITASRYNHTRYNQRARTNANLAKDFVKVKTYSDLIVLKQDAHDKLGEPARWVLYAVDFDKSPYPAMDKNRWPISISRVI